MSHRVIQRDICGARMTSFMTKYNPLMLAHFHPYIHFFISFVSTKKTFLAKWLWYIQIVLIYLLYIWLRIQIFRKDRTIRPIRNRIALWIFSNLIFWCREIVFILIFLKRIRNRLSFRVKFCTFHLLYVIWKRFNLFFFVLGMYHTLVHESFVPKKKE